MLDKMTPRKGAIALLLFSLSFIYLIFSCAPTPIKGKITGIVEEEAAKIESVNVISGPYGKETAIEITSSQPVPYTAFKLVQPLRLIVDVDARLAEELPEPAVLDGRIVKAVHFEATKGTATRVIASLSRDVEYKVQERDRTIRVVVSPKKPVEKETGQVLAAKEEEIVPTEPRLFFSPGKTKLNQVLGIDFFMLPRGRSRVTVTTSKKAEYELSRKNSLTLLLDIKGATIPAELSRYIDSSQFKGVVNRITPIVKVAERQVALEIELKEMVPYHVIQADKEIRLDLNETTVKPPAKKIAPATLVKVPLKPGEVPPEAKPAISPVNRAISPPRLPRKRYTGARMTLDFANADIRNILKLIGEVSKRNIVWGPEVKGTVSMRLKNVPWDQALDIVLEANDLGKREEDNIIWVTTRTKIRQLEKEQEERRKAEQERIKAIRAAQEQAKATEPLVTDYFAIDFAKAEEIKDHIVVTDRGSISVNARTNTIIMKDTAASVEEAKKIVSRFDTPVKQIMIEARIVDASTTFSRDLGVQWNAIEGQRRKDTTTTWRGTPLWAPANVEANFTAGGAYRYGGSFATNTPEGWTLNIGVSFAKLTSSTLGGLALDASLALAETEGKVKIISSPKVIASNGEQAEITRGDIIYKEIVTADQRDIKELPATLSLVVTPTVSFNDYVSMDVEVKDDKVFADLSGKTEKGIKTKLMVQSGETVVIGGIYKEDRAETETGIPWLRSIPFFGWLFKAQITSSERSELLIFLTPNVITRPTKEL
ncbi:MAG: type IV pilus secretin PilQ [Deltaproteobacteria bacterium]|nr:MAG: type IV pilus secretin PilQ [Deltaproteobacteria bacterium]